jgi:hypothetical protein
MKKLRVLVGCERSGKVRQAFRDLGHDAWSCDLVPADDGSEYHIQDNVLNHLTANWDLGIFFPPCTYLCSSGARWWHFRKQEQKDAIAFFLRLANAPIKKRAIENPVGIMSYVYQKPTQYIQPWMFGHGETKKTGLWLYNLQRLRPTKIVSGRESRIHKIGPSDNRQTIRSETYEGIARAMAAQWGAKSKYAF